MPDGAQRVLDVGCGTGALGALLKRRGVAEVVGVTVSGVEAKIAELVLDKVVHADIETADLTALGSFDVVVCSHVLEHLRDPHRVLGAMVDRVAAHGHVIVALPNVLSWRQRLEFLRGRFRYRDGGAMDRGHLAFFDWSTAHALLESAGLEVLETAVEGALPSWLGRVGAALEQATADTNPALFAVQFVMLARPRPATR